MKSNKRKSLVKSARKIARKNIKLSLITELKAVTAKIVPESKKIEKQIAKNAKFLAKKISGELLIDEEALIKADEERKAARALQNPKAVKKEKVAAEKPVSEQKEQKVKTAEPVKAKAKKVKVVTEV